MSSNHSSKPSTCLADGHLFARVVKFTVCAFETNDGFVFYSYVHPADRKTDNRPSSALVLIIWCSCFEVLHSRKVDNHQALWQVVFVPAHVHKYSRTQIQKSRQLYDVAAARRSKNWLVERPPVGLDSISVAAFLAARSSIKRKSLRLKSRS